MAMARKELCQLNYTLSHHRMMPEEKSFAPPSGVIHFSFCRTRSRARLIAVRNLSQDDFPPETFSPALRLRNYKLKVIDMQITITLRNNHHAKRVSRLFIYRGAASIRATFSFSDPRNSISCIRSLIISAETAQRMLRAFQFITLYCVDPAFTFRAKGYVGFIFAEEICVGVVFESRPGFSWNSNNFLQYLKGNIFWIQNDANLGSDHPRIKMC